MAESEKRFQLMLSSYGLFFRLALGVFTHRPGLRRVLIMLVFLPVLLTFMTTHWIAFWLDDVFFPGYKNMRVKRPLFIVGVPRSGTTALHRVLAGDKYETTWFTMWELLFAPAIIERKVILTCAAFDQKIGRPMARLIEWITRHAAGDMNAVHQFSMSDPEEDFLLFVPVMACFILTVAFPDAKAISDLSRFDEAVAPEKQRQLMAFYKSMLQRHLYVHGPNCRLLSKNVSFTPMLRALLKTFPDARVIICTREPSKAVPSQISAIEPSWKFFGNDATTDAFRQRWIELMRHYYQHIWELLHELPPEKAQLVRMRDMKTRLDKVVTEIYHAFNYDITPAFRVHLTAEAEKSRQYKSKHKYKQSDYDIDPEEIEKEFAPLFDQGRDPRKRGNE